VVQAGEKTRLVMNLKQATTYKAEIQGSALFVSLEPVAGTATQAATPSPFSENRNRDMSPLRDVDFRLGAGGAGKIIVDLSNSQTGVDVKQTGKNLVVEFAKSTLPEGLRRQLDVSDFGTPVQVVSARPSSTVTHASG